ncbi:uncharacterized protein LODBEIA_P34020 [Lodderomyces beijingensis]|uniref:25S rRNA (uridine-N(3))-methyltransferase BMT5-like domain-containing protein n=1 Tax=Lodderomyces beijingensis TaxID=1775926 RepID=A0ABP0ZLY8_9ASCO
MAHKLKGKKLSSKGLKGALARHKLQDSIDQKLSRAAEIESQNQQNKSKSITSKKPKSSNVNTNPLRGFNPFQNENTLLLIGEGDFTFAKSLISQNFIQPRNLIATSLDSRDDLISKYPGVQHTLETLQSSGVRLMHEVDATDLPRTLHLKQQRKKQAKLFPDGTQLDFIMFNFPHTGRGVKDQDRNIRDHQRLILSYFQNCKSVFEMVNSGVVAVAKDDFAGYHDTSINAGAGDDGFGKGKIILSVFEGEPYNSWGVKVIAKDQGYKVMKSGKFEWGMFPEYHHKRTNSTRDTTKPAAERNARLYVFEKKPTDAKDNHQNKKKKKNSDSDSDSDDE